MSKKMIMNFVFNTRFVLYRMLRKTMVSFYFFCKIFDKFYFVQLQLCV